MKLLIVSNDVPWPPNSGGRVDVWRRLRALRAAGIQVGLLCWCDGPQDAALTVEVMHELSSYCEGVKVFPIRRSGYELLCRLACLFRMPSHVASRWVATPRATVRTWAAQMAPDVLLLDGLYGGAIARDLARVLRIPLLYRSQNIEHLYMRAQFNLAPTFKQKLGLALNLLGLERFERATFGAARRVFDISIDDRMYWQREGFDHIDWLPPLVDDEFKQSLSEVTEKSIDVLYFGNLNTPNNLDALAWLVREVLPAVGGPALRVVVAGSRPSALAVETVQMDPRIHLVADPTDVAALVVRARVIVNPMLAGSGVNLKSVEMLFSEAHLVSTSIGVKGLPLEAKRCFSIADRAPEFATAIVKCLQARPGAAANQERALARTSFSALGVVELVTRHLTQSVKHNASGDRDGAGRIE